METLRKNVLVIENVKEEYEDVRSCLPEHFNPDYREKIDENAINALGRSDYDLCICDLMDTETIPNGLKLDSPEVFEIFYEGIKRIAKLRKHLGCNLIIITKTPVRYLRDHFNKLQNDSDVKTIFADDSMNLYRKLDAKKTLFFGEVYEGESVHIFIKPYYSSSETDENREHRREDAILWKERFSELIGKLSS